MSTPFTKEQRRGIRYGFGTLEVRVGELDRYKKEFLADPELEDLRTDPRVRKYHDLIDNGRLLPFPAFQLDRMLCQLRFGVPVAQRADTLVAFMDGMRLADKALPPDYHQSNKFAYQWIHRYTPQAPVDGGLIFDQAAFGWQNPETIAEIIADGKPLVKTYDLSSIDRHRGLLSSGIPIIKARFAEAAQQMVALELADLPWRGGTRYLLVTRQEVIGPNCDLRAGLTMHDDGRFVDENGRTRGKIRFAWNAWDNIQTEGYYGNEAGIPLEQISRIQDQVDQRQSWGEASSEAANAYLDSIGASFYVLPSMRISGFVGQDGGWKHRAQRLNWQDGCPVYRDNKGRKHMIREPILRNGVSLLALER